MLALFCSCTGFQPVAGGGAFRSSQLTAKELRHFVREHDIRAVVSLRGAREERAWWRKERAMCEQLGILHFDLGWSAFGVSDDRVIEYLRLLDVLPRPILLHCHSGRDRSGLAAAIFRHHVLGHEPDDAGSELAFVPYGHVAMFGYEAMDEAFARYVRHYEDFVREARSAPIRVPLDRFVPLSRR